MTIGIGDVHFPSQNFDIITMWHSLEHTPNPHMALKRAKSWLKQDGILAIDVPNYNGTDARYKWGDLGWLATPVPLLALYV